MRISFVFPVSARGDRNRPLLGKRSRYYRWIAGDTANPNVWWSLANEWDLMWSKELADWERYARVISEQDPGVPNWLDTGRHRRGTIFWRFLLPESDPETPRCRVVPVSEIAG